MKPPARKLVQCVNEECPDVATTGRPWRTQRAANSPRLLEPCQRCSSAVVVVTPGAEDVTAVRPLRPPYIGRPTVTCHDPVRYGLAAHQRLEALARRKEHRGKTRAELVGWALDQWGAGLPDAPGAA